MDPQTQSDIDKLKNRIGGLETSFNNLVTRGLPPENATPKSLSNQINWNLLTFLLALVIFVGGVVWVAHSQILKVDSRLDATDTQIKEVKIALKLLADEQGGKIKEIVNDALAVAQMNAKSGNHDRAQKVLAAINQIIAEHPQSPESQEAAQKIISTAKLTGIKIPNNIVEKTGNSFIQAASEQPSAWNAAMDYLDYRSSLNASYTPPTPAPKSATPPLANYLEYNTVTISSPPPGGPNKLLVRVAFHGHAGPESAALMDRLEKPPPPGVTSGAQYITVDANGAGIGLDGYRMRNVIVEDAQIFYGGGSVILDNVYFVNCTFKITRNTTGEAFGKVMLAASGVSFRPSG